MTPDTERTLETFSAAPLPAALTQRLLQSAKAAQREAMLDRKTEECLKRFAPAPLTAAQQARLDSQLPKSSKQTLLHTLLKHWSQANYKQGFARVAALTLFLGVGSFAVYSTLHMTPHRPDGHTEADLLAAGQERSSIEHFAPVGYTQHDIIATQADDDIQWKDTKAYQSYKVQYTNSLIVDIDEDTSITISAPQEKHVSVQVQSI